MKTASMDLLAEAIVLLDTAGDGASGRKLTAHRWHERRRAFVAAARALTSSSTSSRAKTCDLCGRAECP